MTENVIAGSDGRGNGDRPAVVIGNELVRCPGPGWRAAVDQANTIDLNKPQLGLINSCAITAAISKIINDWTVVAFWPGGPLELDSSSGSHRGRCLGVGGSLMANDVRIGVAVWSYKTVVQIVRNGPSHDYRSRVRKLKGWIVSSVTGILISNATGFRRSFHGILGAISNDTGHGAMRGNTRDGGNSCHKSGGLHEGHSGQAVKGLLVSLM